MTRKRNTDPICWGEEYEDDDMSLGDMIDYKYYMSKD